VTEWPITPSLKVSKFKRALDYFEKAIKLEEELISKKSVQISSKSLTEESVADEVTAESSKVVSKQDRVQDANNSGSRCGVSAAHLGVA